MDRLIDDAQSEIGFFNWFNEDTASCYWLLRGKPYATTERQCKPTGPQSTVPYFALLKGISYFNAAPTALL